MSAAGLKAPFPWFGGKSRVAGTIWERANSTASDPAKGATQFGTSPTRPHAPRIETDLHARHKHLVARIPEVKALLDSDPAAFDATMAGYWVWGICAWIGSGWCSDGGAKAQLPSLLPSGSKAGGDGRGVHAKGGYAGQSDSENVNARRERVWFSPACLAARQTDLLALLGCS